MAVLFIACSGAAAILIKHYSKKKKALFIVFAAFASLLALVLLIYSVLTFILLGGVSDRPSEFKVTTQNEKK